MEWEDKEQEPEMWIGGKASFVILLVIPVSGTAQKSRVKPTSKLNRPPLFWLRSEVMGMP